MSIETWKQEFVPIDAKDAIGSDKEALDHSIKKWEGLTKDNLDKHELRLECSALADKNNVYCFIINDQNCALCLMRRKMKLICLTGCILKSCNDEWNHFVQFDDPSLMIAKLKEARATL